MSRPKFSPSWSFWLRIIFALLLSISLMVMASAIGYATAGLAFRGHPVPNLIERQSIGTALLVCLALGHFVTALVMFWMAVAIAPVKALALNRRVVSMYVSLGLFMSGLGALYCLSALRIWYPTHLASTVAWAFLISGTVSMFVAVTFPDALQAVRQTIRVARETDLKNEEIKALTQQAERLADELFRLKHPGGSD